MNKLNFEAIVFDFDGVLVESVDVKTEAFASLYAEYGEQIVEKVVSWHLAHGGVSRFEKFRHFHNEFLGRPLFEDEELRLGERFASLVEDAVTAAPWVAGAKEFIDRYWQKVPLYIASGTPEDELRRIVFRRGVTHCFKGVFGAPAKKREILGLIASKEKYRRETMLMVGDAMTDYDGATQSNVMFLGRVPCGKSDPFPMGTVVLQDLVSLSDYVW